MFRFVVTNKPAQFKKNPNKKENKINTASKLKSLNFHKKAAL